MSARVFLKMLEARWAKEKFVCIGLDSEVRKIPEVVWNNDRHANVGGIIVKFNTAIVDATADLVAAYKLNLAFYIANCEEGIRALRSTVSYIGRVAPDVPIILDGKFADIGNTNSGYVEFAFGYLGVDAITVNPYLGGKALMPFLGETDKGIIVLCRTSNEGAGEFQDREVEIGVEEAEFFNQANVRYRTDAQGKHHTFLFLHVAYQVYREWNRENNCALVVGATVPEELGEVRRLVGEMPILIPGVGAQGGDIQKAVVAGVDSRAKGMLINLSRGIIFASQGEDFAEAARKSTERYHNTINQYRKEAETP